MADTAKREKLAAARKKLKQFQQKKGSPAPDDKPEKKGRKARDTGKTDVQLNGGASQQYQAGNGILDCSPEPASSPMVEVTSVTGHSPAVSVLRSPSQISASIGHNALSVSSSSPESSSLQHSQRMTASTERLQQLSRQINGLISQSSAYLSNNNDNMTRTSPPGQSELETRNQELASLLEQHNQLNEQLSKQLVDLRQQNGKLQSQLEGEKKTFEDRIKREVGALKEQLQVHIQTIGILVAEKTELQSSLNQSLKQGDSRAEEVEELSGRLKASRQRVADLEKSFTSASTSSQKHEKSSKEYSKDVDRLKLELYKLNKSNEEYQQQNSELQEKFQKKMSQCSLLEDSVTELRGKLEMTEVLIQQLQNSGSSMGSTQQIEALLREKGDLQAQVDQFKEAFQKLSEERDQLVEQYQQYIDQLTSQTGELQGQVTSVTLQRDQLQTQQDKLEDTVKKNRTVQEKLVAEVKDISVEKDQMSQMLEKLTGDFEDLNKRYQAQITDNSHLSQLVEEGETRMQDLEIAMQRMGDSAVDRDALLESMQSDKTALSRAMAQNRELKNQLAELQNGFVKLSNDNMELLSQLSSEQHVARELAARLGQQEDELKETREQLSHREQEVIELQATRHALSESQLSSEQLEERLRQHDAQQALLEHLQTELSSAQDAINSLTNQNSLLQAQLAESRVDPNGNQDPSSAGGERMDSLNSSVRQLEMERNQVLEQLQEERHLREKAQTTLDSLTHDLATSSPATLNGDIVSKVQFEALQHAMKQLETKYTSAMRDKADLSDRNEQLEHLTMQLQGETDTIGEYVTLYQQQRSILRQRQVEKDDYISRMAREREDMTEKLGQLQALVMQLLGERQMLHSYHENYNQIANHVNHMNEQQTAATTNHKPTKPLEGNLDSSQLEDWPDYTSSDSDTSEVETIVAGSNSTDKPAHSAAQSHVPSTSSSPSSSWKIPAEDHTAHKIMHLLTEIGTSNLVNPSYGEHSFLHCTHCRGPLLCV